jgi:hypothetical protein
MPRIWIPAALLENSGAITNKVDRPSKLVSDVVIAIFKMERNSA